MPISGRGSFDRGPAPRRKGGAVGQRGSAVIGALLIVVIVTAVSVALMTRQSAFVRGVQNEQTRVQARLLMLAGVDWAMNRLREAAARGPVVRWDDEWATALRETRFGDDSAGPVARYSGQIEDAQSRFNLRNLVREGRLDQDEVAVFARLCALVGVKSEVANRIVERVLIAQPVAGEQGPGVNRAAPEDQARAEAARQPPRAPMPRTLDDLLPVPGVDDDVLARLRPVATVLPVPTWINGNSAGPEVLAAQVPGLSLGQAKALLAERDSGKSFINLGDFVNRLGRPDVDVDHVRVGITSEWFLLSGLVAIDRSLVVSRSLIFRSGRSNALRVVWSREGV